MSATFYLGDNSKLIPRYISDKSIDFIYFNPPFATTKQDWDEELDWPLLFKEFKRILKDTGVLAIHCSVPFNYKLIKEAPTLPSYSWYWKKDNTTNPLIAKYQPLRNMEEILVWTNKKKRYYPQRIGNEIRKAHGDGSSKYYGNVTYKSPQKVVGKYQTHFIDMSRTIDEYSTRPIELIELMIKSYTQEGDVILDPTCYKGLCGNVAKRLKRNYIGMDKYFFPDKILEKRV
jgi:site-specific DNA-methyltransferase (adenine-specific)